MASLLFRLGRGAFRHRRAVLAAWLAVLAGVAACLFAFGGSTDDQFTIPGSPSQRALDSMARTFPASSGTNAQIVFVAPPGHRVTERPYAGAIDATMAAAKSAPQVAGVVDPVAARVVSPDRRAAIGEVQYAVSRTSLKPASLDALTGTTAAARHAGLTVEVGGAAYGNQAQKGGHTNEVIGIAIALVVLTVTFGSLFAAGLPLLTAVAGVAVSLLALLALTSVVTISSTAPTLAAMLGLAVGIDYALFVLSRHRSQLAAGLPVEESAARATGTAGSAVVFAGLTVVIALAGLSVVGIPFLTVMGLGAAGAVLVAVAVAVTLLPAVMGFAGERLRPRPGSRTERRERASAAGAAGAGTAASRGERWGRLVTRRPLVTLLAVLIGMLALAAPARDLRLALPDNGSAAAGSSPRQAYDLVDRHFGPGFNGPLLVLATGTGAGSGSGAGAGAGADSGKGSGTGSGGGTGSSSGTGSGAGDRASGAGLSATDVRLDQDLRALPDVVAVAAPVHAAGGGITLFQVIPGSGPEDGATKHLVQTIRDRSGQWRRQTGAEVAVTGSTAVNIDVSDRLAGSLVPFALIVVGLSLLLLLVVFRSIVVPLKASLGFLLSVAATFGAVVAVFQWGWLGGVIGVGRTGPVVSFLPIILMAVLFGLAMDYEVFLVSRMRESHVRGDAARPAVLAGMRNASRVVTGAALIMFAVFCGFVPGADAVFKPIAFSLAFGVLIDAFVIRMTFVPALLALVGDAAWWLPRRLRRVLPDLDIEGERLPAITAPAPTAGPTPQERDTSVQV
ncbi:MMPL family transporter [Streptantibioticus silvisoli]|uniref:MMPL family transporter n=1 Tax=Streptantibioticus silvisoli TaxID=2705255 RepID=A0ABT6W4W3_9ACTN|nr:MMPL family transporter [Streptantibioticus silvisoli]MDI5965410.1 MMPL family transporter [Streptantibioticus silvisoli]